MNETLTFIINAKTGAVTTASLNGILISIDGVLHILVGESLWRIK